MSGLVMDGTRKARGKRPSARVWGLPVVQFDELADFLVDWMAEGGAARPTLYVALVTEVKSRTPGYAVGVSVVATALRFVAADRIGAVLVPHFAYQWSGHTPLEGEEAHRGKLARAEAAQAEIVAVLRREFARLDLRRGEVALPRGTRLVAGLSWEAQRRDWVEEEDG